MKTPEIPKNEVLRLETLHSLDILNTLPHEQFDRLTRIARHTFQVPIAMVTLIDADHQLFKSCIGLDIAETSRETSFCGHAILGDGVFVIPDTREDDRFADNPFVSEDPYLRFYAGCPIRAPNGMKLGTLCVLDVKPRSFGKDDIKTLKDLAALAESEFAALQMATRDELTGIPNRRGFIMLARQSLRLCSRKALPVSLIFVDMVHFKSINDRFGHEEGDRALRRFSEIMGPIFRESDVIGRLGGDEFVTLMPDTPATNARKLVNRLKEATNAHNQEANQGYDLHFSHGISSFSPDSDTSVEELLAEGDERMYEQKRKTTGNRANTGRGRKILETNPEWNRR